MQGKMITDFQIENDFFIKMAKACIGKSVKFLDPDAYLEIMKQHPVIPSDGLSKIGLTSIETDDTIYILANFKNAKTDQP